MNEIRGKAAQSSPAPGARLEALLNSPLMADIRSGRRPGLLLLDYDGTLAPFTPQRHQALPYAGVREALAALPVEGPGRYVMITGREAADLGPLLNIDPLPEIWGCHGGQRRLVSGKILDATMDDAQQKAYRAAEALVHEHGLPATACELKSYSLALHTRGLLPPELARARAVKFAWGKLAANTNLILRRFDGGFELRVPGLDKGVAVRSLAMENPESVLVYLGDDSTDEDAFAALPQTGLGVLARPRWRKTAAQFRLTPPGEVLAFLALWGRKIPDGASAFPNSPRSATGAARPRK